MKTSFIGITLFILAILAVSSCVYPPPPPPPKCPDFNKIQQDFGRNEDFGQPALRSGKASVELNFKPSYIVEVVRSRISAPDISAMKPGDSGMDIGRIWLEENGTGANRINLISISFSVWLKSQQGGKIYLPSRNYTLRLRFVPYLITPANFPDSARRRAVLGCKNGDPDCGDSGVILALRFYELAGGWIRSPTEPVDCNSSTRYDFIDEQVLTQAYNISVQQEPIRIPTSKITGMVSGLVNASVTLTGMDLGTDQYLKIGLVVDKGTPMNFDSRYSELSRHPNTHWGILIDKNLITSALVAKIDENIRNQSASLDGTPQVDYTRDGIIIDAIGKKSVPVCGDVRFSVRVTARPSICRNPAGNSTLRICAGTSEPEPTLLFASGWQQACVQGLKIINAIASIPAGLFSGGVAIVYTGCAGIGWNIECSQPAEIQFSTGSDVLYATQIDTDDMFFIAGRSQFMDSRGLGSPPSLPSCTAPVCP